MRESFTTKLDIMEQKNSARLEISHHTKFQTERSPEAMQGCYLS